MGMILCDLPTLIIREEWTGVMSMITVTSFLKCSTHFLSVREGENNKYRNLSKIKQCLNVQLTPCDFQSKQYVNDRIIGRILLLLGKNLQLTHYGCKRKAWC